MDPKHKTQRYIGVNLKLPFITWHQSRKSHVLRLMFCDLCLVTAELSFMIVGKRFVIDDWTESEDTCILSAAKGFILCTKQSKSKAREFKSLLIFSPPYPARPPTPTTKTFHRMKRIRTGKRKGKGEGDSLRGKL